MNLPSHVFHGARRMCSGRCEEWISEVLMNRPHIPSDCPYLIRISPIRGAAPATPKFEAWGRHGGGNVRAFRDTATAAAGHAQWTRLKHSYEKLRQAMGVVLPVNGGFVLDESVHVVLAEGCGAWWLLLCRREKGH